MNKYKISKGSWFSEYLAESLIDAQNYANSLGDNYNVSFIEVAKLKSSEDVYSSDIKFLKSLFNEFNILNREQPQTPSEMVEMQTKFGNIKLLSDAGSINYVRASIDALTTPIGGVYTEQRKINDLAKIDDYLLTRLYV